MKKPAYRSLLFILIVFLFSIICIHINGGNFHFSFDIIFHSIFDYSPDNPEELILHELRFPRTITGLIAGISLSIAGLLMQTYFNNPLAGPSILGISTGSSLFVAIAIMIGGSFITSDIGIVSISFLGAILFSLLLLIINSFLKSQLSLLIIGVMLSSFTASFIQVIQASADPNSLKAFTIWGFGSIQNVTNDQLWSYFLFFIISIVSLIFIIKPLNLLVLGEKNAALLGLNLKHVRISLIVITALFTGITTAYCGPISFIGLAVPNIVKIIFKTKNHSILILGCVLVGSILILFCDLIIYWFDPLFIIPLNSITSLFGAPLVIWIILRKKIYATS